MRLAFPAPLLDEFRSSMLVDERETCAMFMVATSRPGRALVVSGELAPGSAYRTRTSVAAELSPEYLVDVTSRARRAGLGLVFAHSHPGPAATPLFSSIDDEGETPLAAFMRTRQPGQDHFALVVAPGGLRARRLGGGPEVRVESVGRVISIESDPSGTGARDTVAIYDRQVRAFGAAGQRLIGETTVAIVGLGGTGSVVAQMLAHLGVERFLLVDPDRLETTNLNRVVGATVADVDSPKVEICAALLRSIRHGAQVDTRAADVTFESTAALLTHVDFIFGCTDSHSSRAVISQVAYQHLIPAIDMGVGIAVSDRRVSSITGRVQALAPGLGCLACSGMLDGQVIRREMMNEEQRTADPYFTGGQGEPQPAVISVNSTVASLAVTMFLSMVTGNGAQARYQSYNGIHGTVRHAVANPAPNCLVCSRAGALGRGAAYRLPVRPDVVLS